MKRLALAALFVALPAAAAVDLPRDVVRMQGLDKLTARVSTFDIPVGQTAEFGTLAITARACFEAAPTDPPESAAFLEVVDYPPEAAPADLFSGWMFASSPALSALEHALLDVWVIDCLDRDELAADNVAEAPPDERSPPRRRPE